MPKRKLFHIERDSEEILNIIESCDGTKHFIEEIDNAEELQMVLLPPIDGDNSDIKTMPQVTVTKLQQLYVTLVKVFLQRKVRLEPVVNLVLRFWM